ncbi:MAG: cellulase family glycosylhydrolase [archaeon]|nr:cellulase family glycosylhydrolase [archaeon]
MSFYLHRRKIIAMGFITLVIIGAVFGVYLTLSLFHNNGVQKGPPIPTEINASFGNISWPSLHGVNYAWGALGIQCCANPPSTDFPIMHALGFDLIRVPLSWNAYEENQTAYIGYLNQVANEADSLGIYVVYDAHGGQPWPSLFFPSSMQTGYSSIEAFSTALWTRSLTYNGQDAWTAEWNDFWVPVIQTVDSHPSTLGYEIMNEPNPGTAPLSALQAYNQFIADHIQAISNKYIVFMGPYVSLSAGSDEKVAPTGITKLVMDAHCYIGTSSSPGPCAQNGGIQQNLANVASVGEALGIHIWIGEWAVCNPGGCTVSQSQGGSIIKQYVSQFKQDYFANTYWVWKCDTNSATVGQTDLLTAYPGCNTYWLDTQLSQAEG